MISQFAYRLNFIAYIFVRATSLYRSPDRKCVKGSGFVY